MLETVSAVLIVKNEEQMLSRCLNSVKDAEEIIVCDTGSEDGTVEVARQYTDKVFTDFQWCDDFAAARNHAKSKATKDWILSIDADEYLHSFRAVREAITIAPGMAVTVKLLAADNQQMNLFPRLFQNRPEIQWVGAVHNYPNVIGHNVGDVRITYNYSPAHFRDPDRTLRILQRECRDKNKVREHFYLGREYFYRGEYSLCVQTLGYYVQKSAFLAEKAEAFLIMSRAYWNMKLPDDARDCVVQCLIINPHFKEAILHMAVLAGDGTGEPRWERNAAQWKRLAESATNEDVLFVRPC